MLSETSLLFVVWVRKFQDALAYPAALVWGPQVPGCSRISSSLGQSRVRCRSLRWWTFHSQVLQWPMPGWTGHRRQESSCSLCPPAKEFRHSPRNGAKISARKVIRKQLGVVTIQPYTGHSSFFFLLFFAEGHDNFGLHAPIGPVCRLLVRATRTTLRPLSHPPLHPDP